MRAARAVALALAMVSPTVAAEPTLRFLRDGDPVGSVERAELARRCAGREVELDDPYYKKRMRYRACPLAEVLRAGLGDALDPASDLLFKAADGFVSATTGAQALEDGGWLAFADARRAAAGEEGWEPIDRKQVDPAPFYVVWSKPEQGTHRYPWPYQLVSVEAVSFAKRYPATLPRTAPRESASWRGFATFRRECVSCHSVNGQGGKVGPDLNVPRSIVEYRPVDQIKAYVLDPAAFRYTSMPAHRHLKPADLDDLIAYFRTMKTLKQDPGKRAP